MSRRGFGQLRGEFFHSSALFADAEFAASDENLFYHQPPAGVSFEWKRPKVLKFIHKKTVPKQVFATYSYVFKLT